ncbi:MAG: hypothetical protein BRC26_01025 [Nanohaloarchaea archaeon QH_8_44_6]|nr:MAG: hypothetical protein BRC26_01025 [Nanohaloarchaea archaeon QH_8_44_6]
MGLSLEDLTGLEEWKYREKEAGSHKYTTTSQVGQTAQRELQKNGIAARPYDGTAQSYFHGSKDFGDDVLDIEIEVYSNHIAAYTNKKLEDIEPDQRL